MLSEQRAEFCCLEIPSDWGLPLYQFGQTVFVRNSAATVIGVVCFPPELVADSQAASGWHYCLSFHPGTQMWQSWRADGVFSESEVSRPTARHSVIRPVSTACGR